jgi:DNA-binding transcriptional LysR family regulator
MRGSDFADLRAFATVADQGNFSRAARNIGVSPSALSQTIRELETRLGARLFNRTTRSVALTEAGHRLLARVQPLFAEFDAALENAGSLHHTPNGTLRICAQRVAVAHLVQPVLPRFQALYPEIVLDLTSEDSSGDIFCRGFDAGIRLGEYLEKDVVAVKIGPDLRMLAVASPSYLEKHGRPETPDQLAHHRCINWRLSDRTSPYRWEFAKDGKHIEVSVKGSLLVNDCAVAFQAARDGLGIAIWMDEWMRPDIEAGHLVPLLEAWSPVFPGFFLYHPSRRQMPATLRAFIEVLRDGHRPRRGAGHVSDPNANYAVESLQDTA